MLDDIQRLEEKVSNLIAELLKLREENLILSERARAFELTSEALDIKEKEIDELKRKNEVLELKLSDTLERLSEKTDEIRRLSEIKDIKDEITKRVKNLIEKISQLEAQTVEKDHFEQPTENDEMTSELKHTPFEIEVDMEEEKDEIIEEETSQIEEEQEDKIVTEQDVITGDKECGPKIIYNKIDIKEKSEEDKIQDYLKDDIISLEEDIDEEEVSENDNVNIFNDITLPEKKDGDDKENQ
ncbi:MAG: hypothetical protein ACUVWP_08930 [bacterium]